MADLPFRLRAFADSIFAKYDHTSRFEEQFGGQFRLDNNEINGMGNIGPYDNTMSQNLGNASATKLRWQSGGFMFNHAVRLKSMQACHRNNNNTVGAWGWVVSSVKHIENSTATLATDFLIHEVNDNNGVGPRDYGSNRVRMTKIKSADIAQTIIPAGNVVNVAVCVPIAAVSGRYVQVQAGVLEFERV